MNKIINKFLLAGDKFMPEIHLKQPWFTYSACGPFTKNKERNQTGDTKYIYRSELDKACFQHDMIYAGFKELERRNASDKVLRDKHLILLKILTDIREGLHPWFTNFLIKSPQVVVLMRL